jgi:hypothetical protein
MSQMHGKLLAGANAQQQNLEAISKRYAKIFLLWVNPLRKSL